MAGNPLTDPDWASDFTDTIVDTVRSLARRTKVWGALDTLENLKKGGRIGGAKALLASALAIKPIIEVRDGKVEQGGKQRTRSKALAFIVEQLVAAGQVEHPAMLVELLRRQILNRA